MTLRNVVMMGNLCDIMMLGHVHHNATMGNVRDIATQGNFHQNVTLGSI